MRYQAALRPETLPDSEQKAKLSVSWCQEVFDNSQWLSGSEYYTSHFEKETGFVAIDAAIGRWPAWWLTCRQKDPPKIGVNH